MSAAVLLRYSYACSDGEFIDDDWRELDQGNPTVCRNNTSHTVVGTPIIKQRVDPSITTIQEEQTPTDGGNYCFDTISFDIPADSTASDEQSWEENINILSFSYVTTAAHTGDEFYGTVGEDSVVCGVGADVDIGAVTLVIPSSMFLPYLCRGYKLKITNGTTADDLGFIRGVNHSTCEITVQTATTRQWLSSNSQLLVTRIIAGRVGPIEIGPPWSYSIGKDKIGTSFLPAGKKVKITYTNKSAEAKRFVVIIRYLY